MRHLKIYTFLTFLLAAGLYSCKKDLGNYTYNAVDMPVADTASISATYNVAQYDHLVITPKINFGGDTANLSYQWLVYVKSQSSVTIGPPTIISEQKNLNQKININPGNYYLELVITDNKSGIKTNSRSLLNILAIIENGWLVLHSKNNESEVDFISNPNLLVGSVTKRLRNLAFTQTGSAIKGEGQMIGFGRRSGTLFNWITVGTDQQIKRFNGYNFTLMGADQQLFRRAQSSFSYIGYLNNGSNELLIDKNGILQSLSWSTVPEAVFGGDFNGDYSLSPYIVFNDFSSYGALVYDQKNSRFLYTTQTTSNLNFVEFKPSAPADPNASPPIPAQVFDPSNVGKDLLFMDRGFNKNAYAFFKDKTGAGRYMYVLDLTKADDGRLAIANYNMTALPDVQNAKFYQVGDVGGAVLYATEKKIYTYNYSGTQTATMVFDGISANEKMTCMKIFKPNLNPNNNPNDFILTNNTVVYVATWDGTQGKLYELKMNSTSGIITTVLNTYDGFGKITDMTAKFRGTGL